MVKLLLLLVLFGFAATVVRADEPLFDWSDWEKYRGIVKHPCTTIKQADIERARENIKRYEWAATYARRAEQNAQSWIDKLTPEFLENMIPATTPLTTLGTPCPACRDMGKPPHMHGSWDWSVSKPDEIVCNFCKSVFPNDKYPESIVLRTTWGKPQTLTYCGGDTFRLFSYKLGRPSFTGHIRARKASWAGATCRSLAEAYALTGKPEFAQACRRMLLRFVEVYPTWLIHEGYGYGEVADMDPRTAAQYINDLPKPELCYPPNEPDRKLHTGYWSAGRGNACGMDGGFIRVLTEAYDLTCEATADGKPVYSDEERRRIEKDVLLEGTILFVCDKSINNKSVGNRTATAIVGMCVGHPGLVRFGLDGFMKTVDEWYLPDGCTSESPGYGLMTLGGIVSAGQAFHGYSDPPGYKDAEGKRIEGLDLYHDTSYGKVWEAFFNGLQGNLCYPPYADSYAGTSLSSSFAELMADNYPDRPKYLSLLKEICGNDLTKGYGPYAIYYRDPGLETKETPPPALPDICFPELRLGHLRTGAGGRDGLLLLSASHWGGHHHHDSLNLYYWEKGRELLTDLGYLWDHPMSLMTRRTAAHNLVVLDEKEQRSREREGEFHLFSCTPNAKVMEASSKAYADAKMYRRTSGLVLHGGESYVVDLFRVEGGEKQDYLFHGMNNTYKVHDLDMKAFADEGRPFRFALQFHLAQQGDEIQVDDVRIVRVGDKDIARNGSAAEVADGTDKPAGWGCYIGDGKCEWGVAHPGRSDANCAFIRATERHQNGRMNVALLQGESDGYRGSNAYEGRAGEKYEISFAVKGKARQVGVSVIMWKNNPNDAGDRSYAAMPGVDTIKPTSDWVEYKGAFSLPTFYGLENVKGGDGSGVWGVTWAVDEKMKFVSVNIGQPGETAFIGDGWGQRDHRNTDFGAVIPYIVRRCTGPGQKRFVSLFEGYEGGSPLIQSARRLAVPDAAKDNTVALQVNTRHGVDYIISSLASKLVTIGTPDGPIETDARFAVVSVKGGQVISSSITEGNGLKWKGQPILAK